MKILIIQGSPRKNSLTRALANFVYGEAKKNHDTTILDLGLKPLDNFTGYKEPYSKYTTETVESFDKYDAYIVCSPIYNGMITSLIKNLFEHIPHKGFEGKVASFIITAGGKVGYLKVQEQLSGLMTYFNILSNTRAVFVGREHFDEEFNLSDEDTKDRIRLLIDTTSKMKDHNFKTKSSALTQI